MSQPPSTEKRFDSSDPEDNDDEEKKQPASMLLATKHIPCIAVLFTLTALLLLVLSVVLLLPFNQLIPTFLQNNECCVCSGSNNPASSSSHWESADIIRIYNEDPDLIKTERDSPAQQSWEDILEPLNGHGAIHSTNASSQINGISMFHHIHCLIVIRAFVFPETSINSTKNNTQHPQPGNPGRDLHHVAHCFDYIAQVSRLVWFG